MGTAGRKSNHDVADIAKIRSDLLGALSSAEVRDSLARLAKELAALRASGAAPRVITNPRQRRHRPGWVRDAVRRVLTDRGEPMRVTDIHAAVETLVGETVSLSSVNAVLSGNVSGVSPRFVRIARGRYVLRDDSPACS